MVSVQTLSLMINLKEMLILSFSGHFWPAFGMLWPQNECLMVQMSIFFLVLSGLSEIGKNIPNNNDQFEENADFCHLRPFLACFWPVMAPV